MLTPRFGLALPNYGLHSDPDQLGDLARLAEDSGWDGIFLYDTILMPGTDDVPISDPWIDMAMMAGRTSTIRIGFLVVPLPRHRPWQVARMATTLDHLSGGRFVLGVGAGDTSDRGFGAFGEEIDATSRARLLDEGLEIITGLWDGNPFSFRGDRYTVDNATFLPTPVQSPRIPIWVAIQWPARKTIERAARRDGAVTYLGDASGDPTAHADTVREIVNVTTSLHKQGTPIDIVIDHRLLHIDDRQRRSIQDIAAAGATWIVEYVPLVRDVPRLIDGIRNGPPSLRADREPVLPLQTGKAGTR